eukprot:TRINITY_DN39210_c0_g1_i1.p1 TRINITY_DN39210_c0_g1~~TRINITY_DN39210_c0_g1_i1.p1  ORF type:complete len:365 (+),score=78.16 TRINITY_DN39210_c0_g1_i1:78-1172(+)
MEGAVPVALTTNNVACVRRLTATKMRCALVGLVLSSQAALATSDAPALTSVLPLATEAPVPTFMLPVATEAPTLTSVLPPALEPAASTAAALSAPEALAPVPTSLAPSATVLPAIWTARSATAPVAEELLEPGLEPAPAPASVPEPSHSTEEGDGHGAAGEEGHEEHEEGGRWKGVQLADWIWFSIGGGIVVFAICLAAVVMYGGDKDGDRPSSAQQPHASSAAKSQGARSKRSVQAYTPLPGPAVAPASASSTFARTPSAFAPAPTAAVPLVSRESAGAAFAMGDTNRDGLLSRAELGSLRGCPQALPASPAPSAAMYAPRAVPAAPSYAGGLASAQGAPHLATGALMMPVQPQGMYSARSGP